MQTYSEGENVAKDDEKDYFTTYFRGRKYASGTTIGSNSIESSKSLLLSNTQLEF
jgi:hypothetical protein